MTRTRLCALVLATVLIVASAQLPLQEDGQRKSGNCKSASPSQEQCPVRDSLAAEDEETDILHLLQATPPVLTKIAPGSRLVNGSATHTVSREHVATGRTPISLLQTANVLHAKAMATLPHRLRITLSLSNLWLWAWGLLLLSPLCMMCGFPFANLHRWSERLSGRAAEEAVTKPAFDDSQLQVLTFEKCYAVPAEAFAQLSSGKVDEVSCLPTISNIFARVEMDPCKNGHRRRVLKLRKTNGKLLSSIGAPNEANMHYDIRGSDGRPWGQLRADRDGLFHVKRQGHTIMSIEKDCATFQMKVSTPAGQLIASLSEKSESTLPRDCVEFTWQAGHDAIMTAVLACLLGMIVLPCSMCQEVPTVSLSQETAGTGSAQHVQGGTPSA